MSMRKLLTIALFCLALGVAPSFAVPAFDVGNICVDTNAGVDNVACTLTIGAGGRLLVGIAQWGDSTPRTATISSTAGNTCTWSTAITRTFAPADQYSTQMFYCLITNSGSTTATLQLSGTSSYKALAFLSYSGVSTTSPLDVVSSGAADSGTVCSSGTTATLAQTGELVVGSCTGWDVAQTWPTVSGWTMRASAGNSALQPYDLVAGVTTGQVLNVTIASDRWTGLIATFKPASAGAVQNMPAVVY